MTKLLPFLRPSFCRKFRPTSPTASSAHLRLYNILHSSQSDNRTPDFRWQQQTPASEHASTQDRLYPRIASHTHAISGSHFRSRYSSLQQDDVEENEEVILRGISHGFVNELKLMLLGRVSNQRSAGLKLRFLELQQQDGRPIQIVCNYAKLEDQSSEQAYQDFLHNVRRGDIYSCKGSPYRTSRGELSLRITELPNLLAPCQHPFPSTLSDQETKIRNRHLDLWTNKRSAETFRLRSDIIQRIRQFLLASGHREVQTPILADEAGGAVARPFNTFATEFPGRQISLRTAPELWLKRLVLGGFERVFEIGPCFRNEGLDLNHNPEYTTCEFYQAYSNLEDLVVTTENLFAILATLTREQISIAYRNLPPLDVNFTPPFSRLDFIPTLETALKQPLPDLTAPTAATDLLSILQAHNIPSPVNPTLPRLLDRLSSTYLEPQCDSPTFIMHHPECLSPLSKSFIHPTTQQRVAARAELFVKGQELVNMYEEENSPFEQRRKFLDQLKYKGDDSDSANAGEATRRRKHKEERGINESYLKALEWGLPPTGGWGCGIDRLCMLFSGAERISDVLAFGNLRNVVSLGRARGGGGK